MQRSIRLGAVIAQHSSIASSSKCGRQGVIRGGSTALVGSSRVNRSRNIHVPTSSDRLNDHRDLSTDEGTTSKDMKARASTFFDRSNSPPSTPASEEVTAVESPPTPRQGDVSAKETQPGVRSEATSESKRHIPESNSDFAELDKKPLPFLNAPLGVPARPSSKKLTWIERRDRQLDDQLRMQRRKAIVKEATRGYFHDVHAMRAHGGKTWIAPTTMIRQDRALYFPAMEGQRLSDRQKVNTADMLPGKVSVVCILTSQLSEKHCQSFWHSINDVYKSDEDFQLVRINLQENFIKAALVSIFAARLRQTLDEHQQKTYMLSSHDMTIDREALALHNKHVGYLYLVGPDGKIRWAGCGFAKKSEAQALMACTGVLLSRLREEKK